MLPVCAGQVDARRGWTGGCRRAPRDDLDAWLCRFVNQEQPGAIITSAQFDANGSCRITHPEQHLAICFNTELGTDLPGRINQLKALPPKNRRAALGRSHSMMTEYDDQENQVDDRDNDS